MFGVAETTLVIPYLIELLNQQNADTIINQAPLQFVTVEKLVTRYLMGSEDVDVKMV